MGAEYIGEIAEKLELMAINKEETGYEEVASPLPDAFESFKEQIEQLEGELV